MPLREPPEQLSTAAPGSSDSHAPGSATDGWWNLFADNQERPRGRMRLIWALILATIVIGVVVWLVMPSGNSGASKALSPRATATPTASPPNVAAVDRLLHLMPPGVDPGDCVAEATTVNAVAKFSCESPGPAGPSSATFTLARDDASLKASFETVLKDLTTATCPGNILSPGPWHSNNTPQQNSGTLVCGFHEDVPMVAWTTDNELLLSTVQATGGHLTLDQLYSWWQGQ